MWMPLEAFLWGLLSAVSLPLGVLAGRIKNPPSKIKAILMAFGGGALLFALSVELFGDALFHHIHTLHGENVIAIGFTISGAAIFGGLLFEFVNYQLNRRGAFLRSLSTKARYLNELRFKLYKNLLKEIREVEIFKNVPERELRHIFAFMMTENFETDDVIFFDMDSHTPLYFILSGKVKLTFQASPDPKDLKEREFVPHDVFGEINLVTGQIRRGTAVAVEPTKVLSLNRADLAVLLRRCPSLEKAMNQFKQTSKYLKQGETINLSDLEVTDNDLVTSTRVSLERPDDWDQESSDSSLSVHEVDEVIPVSDETLVAHEKEKARSGTVAFAIWLGILFDGIPESLVIGIVAASESGMSFALIAGVFLANFPEALSSSVIMREGGMSFFKVLMMWTSIMIVTGIGAGIGALIFGGAVSGVMYYFVIAIQGVAGGAMLVLISKTMLPEAFELGGEIVGMSTLCGFLAALIVKILSE